MKNKVLALIGATAAFVSSGLITYKLLNRRRPNYRSFGEIYEDNLYDPKGGDLFE